MKIYTVVEKELLYHNIVKKKGTVKFRVTEGTPPNSKGKNSRENHNKKVQKIWVKICTVVEKELLYHNTGKKNGTVKFRVTEGAPPNSEGRSRPRAQRQQMMTDANNNYYYEQAGLKEQPETSKKNFNEKISGKVLFPRLGSVPPSP